MYEETDTRGMEAVVKAEKVFVFVDKTLEQEGRLRLQVEQPLLILPPWEVVVLPRAQFPIVLAYVAVPAAP